MAWLLAAAVAAVLSAGCLTAAALLLLGPAAALGSACNKHDAVLAGKGLKVSAFCQHKNSSKGRAYGQGINMLDPAYNILHLSRSP
jgi:hypothetical protein